MLLLFFLLSAIIPTAALRDGGFATWCTGDLLASSLDTDKPEGRQLDNGMKCRQSYDFPGIQEASAISICGHKSPFTVDSATVKDDVLTCVWKRTGECNEGHYIRSYCYKVVPKCSGSWKLHRMDNSEASRWLALYFSSSKVAKVAVSNNYKITKKKYSRGVLQPTTDEESKSLEKVAVLNRMPPFGVNPGDIVYLEKGQEAQSICREKARNEPKTALEPGSGSGAIGGVVPPYAPITSKDGSFVLYVLANLYTPKLDANGNIDFKYFHQVCNNIMDGAYAATPYYLNDTLLLGNNPLGEKRYYLPGGRGFISLQLQCNQQQRPEDIADLDEWKVLLHPNHLRNGNHYDILHAKHWKKGLPNKECSDQGRYALAFQEGKTIDVPIFDRLPIICVTGSEPHLPTNVHRHCLKNSEPDLGKDKGCKCKAGFQDVLSLTKKEHLHVLEHAKVKGIPKGYVCVKVNCGTTTHKEGDIDAILFVVDGSGSINNRYINTPHGIVITPRGKDYFQMLRDFIYGGATWLPKEVRILILQYSAVWSGYNWQFSYYFGQTNKNWNENQYRQAAANAITHYLSQSTPTYEAIELMTDKWLTNIPQPQKALMYVITDGVANGRGGFHDNGSPNDPAYRTHVIQKVRSNGINLKYVTVGEEIKLDLITGDVKDPAKDIIHLEDYERLKEDLPRLITDSWCDELTVAHYEDAAQQPYE